MSIKSVIDNLQSIKREIPKINSKISTLCLQEIRDLAILNLRDRQNNAEGTWGVNLVEYDKWDIIQTSKGTSKLLCNDEIGTYVEFGIGMVGSYSPHELSDDLGYEYDLPSTSKKEDGSWSFKDQNGNWFTNFYGYIGKYFLYDAFTSFKFSNSFYKISKKVYDEEFKRVIKNV